MYSEQHVNNEKELQALQNTCLESSPFPILHSRLPPALQHKPKCRLQQGSEERSYEADGP
jgi:hypothetical protein